MLLEKQEETSDRKNAEVLLFLPAVRRITFEAQRLKGLGNRRKRGKMVCT